MKVSKSDNWLKTGFQQLITSLPKRIILTSLLHKVQIYVTHRLPTRQQTQQMPLVDYDFTHNECSKYSSLVDKFYCQRGGSANSDLFQ